VALCLAATCHDNRAAQAVPPGLVPNIAWTLSPCRLLLRCRSPAGPLGL